MRECSIRTSIRMHTGVESRIGWRSVRGAALLCCVTIGCSPKVAPRSSAQPAVSVSPGDLMSAADRRRLEALVVERARGRPEAGYRIGPDDLLDVRIPDMPGMAASPPETHGDVAAVAGSPQFQQGVRVGASGDVRLPLIGFVRAEGLTPEELEEAIAERLKAAGILREPQVSVLVAEYRSRVVAVVGSVERPGLYPVSRPGATLADLIWAAGGPTKDAGRLVAFTPVGAESTMPKAVMTMAMTVESAGPLVARTVRSEPSGRGRRIYIELSRRPEDIREFMLTEPPRIVVDVEGPAVTGTATTRWFLQEDPLASGVRASGHDGSLRVVVDLRSMPPTHTVQVDGTRLVVEDRKSVL